MAMYELKTNKKFLDCVSCNDTNWNYSIYPVEQKRLGIKNGTNFKLPRK